MRFVAVKHLRDRLGFIGRERWYIDKRLNSVLAYRSNDSASVCVAGQNHRAIRAFERTSQRKNVVLQRGKWYRSASDPKALAFERQNHLSPTGAVRPRSVN